ncbi:MAG TPA: DUF6264 family protein [Microbacteriaceae bacterium]|nr:DUF6264 family protein [Microbacteriaceae bacterium]
MGDERERPRYGEYATPEEQQRSIQDPEARRRIARAASGQAADEGPAAEGPGAGARPPRPASDHGLERARGSFAAPTGSHRGMPGVASADGRAPGRRWDLILTLVLLAVGLLDVVTSVSSYLHLDQTLAAVYQRLGVHASPAAGDAATAGAALVAVRVGLWVVAAGLAAWRLTARRLAFWIPLVAAAVSYVVIVVVMLEVVFQDPAVRTFLQNQ